MRCLLVLLSFVGYLSADPMWVFGTGANDSNTVSWTNPTQAGDLDVVLAFPSTDSDLYVTDNQNQSYTLDGCGELGGDGYACIWYVCNGAAGVTSATLGGSLQNIATEFFEASGAVSFGCADNFESASGTTAPSLISFYPDQSNDLAVVGFACAGDGGSINGNAEYGNQIADGGDPVATAVLSSTAQVTAETDGGSSACATSDESDASNGWNASFAAFKTEDLQVSAPEPSSDTLILVPLAVYLWVGCCPRRIAAKR